MALYLVQHGKTLAKEVDPARGLSEVGLDETRRIAEVAKGYGVSLRVIKHSGKLRAEQTAAVFADALAPEDGVGPIDGIEPLGDVAAFADTIDPARDAMFVGHLPFLERLTGLLTAGSVEAVVYEFQNSGIVCLDLDAGDRGWVVKWSLSPNIG